MVQLTRPTEFIGECFPQRQEEMDVTVFESDILTDIGSTMRESWSFTRNIRPKSGAKRSLHTILQVVELRPESPQISTSSGATYLQLTEYTHKMKNRTYLSRKSAENMQIMGTRASRPEFGKYPNSL
jgi:hypothetical protein